MSKVKPTRSLRQSPARNIAHKSPSPSYQPSSIDKFLLKTDDLSYEQPKLSPTFRHTYTDNTPKSDPLSRYLNITSSAKNERSISPSVNSGNTRQSSGYSSPSLNFVPKKILYSNNKVESNSNAGLNSTAESIYRDELNRVLDENNSIKHRLEVMEGREQGYSEKIEYLEKENQRLHAQVLQKDQVISDLASQIISNANKINTNNTLNSRSDTERCVANLETKGNEESPQLNSTSDVVRVNEAKRLMVSKGTQVDWSEATECQKCSFFFKECEKAWEKLSEIEQTCSQMIENSLKLRLEYDDYKQHIENKGAKIVKNETELKVKLDNSNIISQELKSEVQAIRSFLKRLIVNPETKSNIKGGRNQNKARKSFQKVSDAPVMTQNIKALDHFPAFMKAVSLGNTLVKKDKL